MAGTGVVTTGQWKDGLAGIHSVTMSAGPLPAGFLPFLASGPAERPA